MGECLSTKKEIKIDIKSLKRRFREISLNRLVKSPVNTRLYPHKYENVIRVLERSISEVGVLEPLIVRPSSERGKYEVICGWLRKLAAERAGLERVPCIVIDGLDDKSALILSLQENVQRGSLSEDEIQENIRRLYEDYKVEPSEISRLIGFEVDYIYRLLNLSKMLEDLELVKRPGRWRQEIEAGEEKLVPVTIAISADKVVSTIERNVTLPPEKRDQLAKRIAEEMKDLKQKAAQRVVQEVRKVIRGVKEPEKVERVVIETIEKIKRITEKRKQVTVMILDDLLFEVRDLAKRYGISDDDVIECSIEYSLKENRDSFMKFLEERRLKRRKEWLSYA